jgi:vesicle transport through interaction with t-SNAREs protein 1
MSNPLDTDAGSELFSSYETELKLVQADLNQKLDQIAESSGEQRKTAISLAERALDEANELVCRTSWTPASMSRLTSLR